jgi:regulator of protease activity HflC (stomatin/prohibitin superfamily)
MELRKVVVGFAAFAVMFAVAVGLVFGVGALWATYNVWSKRMKGEAEYAQATQNRRIKVLEAQANLDAAALRAQTDVVRAQGVAKANRIISDSLGGPEGYLRWKYIEMLEDTGHDGRDVIYIPTESALPILEAGRRPTPKPAEK